MPWSLVSLQLGHALCQEAPAQAPALAASPQPPPPSHRGHSEQVGSILIMHHAPEDQLPTWLIVVMCLAALAAQGVFLVTITVLRRKKKQRKAMLAAQAAAAEAAAAAAAAAAAEAGAATGESQEEGLKQEGKLHSSYGDSAADPCEADGAVAAATPSTFDDCQGQAVTCMEHRAFTTPCPVAAKLQASGA
ncbi:hypothetical protein ABPG75_004062 [Micractinium tetrahymenae]